MACSLIVLCSCPPHSPTTFPHVSLALLLSSFPQIIFFSAYSVGEEAPSPGVTWCARVGGVPDGDLPPFPLLRGNVGDGQEGGQRSGG